METLKEPASGCEFPAQAYLSQPDEVDVLLGVACRKKKLGFLSFQVYGMGFYVDPLPCYNALKTYVGQSQDQLANNPKFHEHFIQGSFRKSFKLVMLRDLTQKQIYGGFSTELQKRMPKQSWSVLEDLKAATTDCKTGAVLMFTIPADATNFEFVANDNTYTIPSPELCKAVLEMYFGDGCIMPEFLKDGILRLPEVLTAAHEEAVQGNTDDAESDDEKLIDDDNDENNNNTPRTPASTMSKRRSRSRITSSAYQVPEARLSKGIPFGILGHGRDVASPLSPSLQQALSASSSTSSSSPSSSSSSSSFSRRNRVDSSVFVAQPVEFQGTFEEKAGILNKYNPNALGFLRSKWNKRFFYTKGHNLYYKKDASDQYARGKLVLSQCSIEVDGAKYGKSIVSGEKGHFFAFRVFVKGSNASDTKQHFRLSCSDEKEGLDWIRVLGQRTNQTFSRVNSVLSSPPTPSSSSSSQKTAPSSGQKSSFPIPSYSSTSSSASKGPSSSSSSSSSSNLVSEANAQECQSCKLYKWLNLIFFLIILAQYFWG